MDKIIATFQPHIDGAALFDIVRSKKFGWVMVPAQACKETPIFIADRQQLMAVLTETFLDLATGGTAQEIADDIRRMMRPYLAQLPPDCADIADSTLRGFVTLDTM